VFICRAKCNKSASSITPASSVASGACFGHEGPATVGEGVNGRDSATGVAELGVLPQEERCRGRQRCSRKPLLLLCAQLGCLSASRLVDGR